MASIVLDSSAVLASIQAEPGSEYVDREIAASTDAFISSVNLVEVVSKLVDRGASGRTIRVGLAAMNLVTFVLDEELAFSAGFLRQQTRSAGLSLGDRACLALGMRLRVPVLTTERSWPSLGLPIQIEVIR